MARSTQNQQQSKQSKQPKQAQEQPKQAKTKGALTPSAAVRLWNGDLVSRSMLVAEENELVILTTELQLKKAERRVVVATHRRAEVRGGRVHPLDSPITVGTGAFGLDEALTRDEAKTRVEKWLKRAATLEQLAKQGDTESAEKAKALREKAKTLARAYNLKINKEGAVELPAETKQPKPETK